MIKKIILIVILIYPLVSFAQKSRKWKKMRYEFIAAIGVTSFMGELGGSDKIGSHLASDIEVSQTRPLFFVGARYRVTERLSFKSGVFWGFIAGNDAKTKEFARSYRNLSFRSQIYEFNNQFEYSIIKEPKSHKYSLQKVPGVKGMFRFKTNTYVFTGLNVFYFNPKAEISGKWVALQPLGTEGQGIIPTRKKYSRISVSIPVGFGIKWMVQRLWCVGLEYGYRISFSDYLDDVSTSYISKNLFTDDIAMKLSDRSNGENPSWTSAGQQRGDPRYNDGYMFITCNLVYKLRTGKSGRPMF